MKTDQQVWQKAGYSLVEISLAMLVAAMGIMAVFALFPTSLDASRKGADATETSAFAECVFASLENAAMTQGWSFFANDQVKLYINKYHALYNWNNAQPAIEAAGNSEVNVFYWKPGYWGDYTNTVMMANYEVAYFTYTLDISAGPGATRVARLKVWAGDVKDAVESTDPPGEDVPGGTVFIRSFAPPQI